jgi:pantothenate kinase type III
MFVIADVNTAEIRFSIIGNDGVAFHRFAVSISEDVTNDQYYSFIKNSFEVYKISFESVLYIVVVSMIPKFEAILQHFFTSYAKVAPIILTHEKVAMNLQKDVVVTDVPVVSLVSSNFAMKKFSSSNVIVVNFEPVITFSVICDKTFVGFVAYPGMDMLSSVVHYKTFLFPEVLVKSTENAYQKDAYGALHSGIFIGFIGACDNIIANIKSNFPKKKFIVVATGNAGEIVKYSSQIEHFESEMYIEGILDIVKKIIITKSN